jgi:VWFA-related protein
MNRLAIVLLLLTALVHPAPNGLSQTVQTPAQPAQSPQLAPVAQDDVIRVTTELVQTDVSVVDKQGRFVDGLDREKFELRVNGKEQPIVFFEQVQAGSSKEANILTSRDGGPPTAPVKETTTSAVEGSARERGRTAFLFVDDLHLSPSSTSRTKDLLLKYVDEVMGSKDQVMIATASGQLGFLQQLTSDRNVLHAAIKRLTHRPSSVADMIGSPPMNEYQAAAIENGDRDALSYFLDKQCEEIKRMGRGFCAPSTGMTNNAVYDDAVARTGRVGTTSGTSPGPLPGDPTQPTRGVRSTSAGTSMRATAEREVRSRAQMIARQAAQITLKTLSSLESLVSTSSQIRERKLVVFISDGFFLNYLRSNNAYDLRRIADAALRSGTVIYTIDTRGLVTGSIDASTKDAFDPEGRSVRLKLAEVTAAQDPLNALASDTGGRALLNTNDLQKGISQALQETSTYYLLAWRPESTDLAKDRFRRIEVRVKDHPDLTVRVRSGFFADDRGITATGSAGARSSLSVEDQLMEAIRAGYPRAAVPVSVSLGYLDKSEDGLTLAASIQIERSAKLSDTPSPSGEELDVIGSLIDDQGNILSTLKQKVSIPADQSKNADSMVVTLQFPKVAPGLRQVRIAARDSRSGRIGSAWQWIDIPDLTKGGLSLSSIFLTEGSSGSRRMVLKPDARFTKTQKLRFQTHVYHAASPSKIVMQVQLRRDGQMMTETPASPVPTEGVKDLTRIPVVGEFPLESFQTGQYELTIVVIDQSTKTSASQKALFVIQ